MHGGTLDGPRRGATLHACLDEGSDAHVAIGAIKRRLAARHGIGHATVEPEYGCCADDHGDDADHGRNAVAAHRHVH
jgi:cobalt-zinc-cadmium efflux system protein